MKNYTALSLVSYLYRLAAILVMVVCCATGIYYEDMSLVIVGTISALLIYAGGELLQLLIDIAKNISIQAEIKRREYKATLGAAKPPRKLQRLADRKKAV